MVRRKSLWIVGIVIVAGAWPFWRFAQWCGQYVGAARYTVVPVAPGPLCPPPRNEPPSAALPKLRTARGQASIEAESRGSACEGKRGRAINIRAAIAKLYLGKDIEEVNQCLRAATPWKESGSTWFGHPSGDYDFDEIDFVALLYTFRDQPDRLYPETAKHIVDVLLIEDGAKPRPKVPRTLGLVTDTENHILMTEGTRYLRNQWRFERGDPGQRGNPAFDNTTNGLGAWLLDFLKGIEQEGFYEFNSIPYLSYAMRALLNLDAFASNTDISGTARYILDKANWQYALGSLDLRRCTPFRRQPYRADVTDLRDDEHTPLMQVWTGGDLATALGLRFRGREETLAEILPYRLPEAVRQWTLAKPSSYFVRFGHGPNASPELYSGGPSYLISAGGVARGWRSMIAARPTSLLLRDGAADLKQCFRLTGRGGWTAWNNTGVCDRFACANGEVHVPDGQQPQAASGAWTIYGTPGDAGLRIATYQGKGFALLALFPGCQQSADALAKSLVEANPNETDLGRIFHWPGVGTVEYNPDAPKGTWVISAIDGKPADRDYDRWPQIDGDGPKILFNTD